MRVRARIPAVKPRVMKAPQECPYDDCQGVHFKTHEKRCEKRVRDTQYEQVLVCRRKCLRCKRSHRVYPQGVSGAQQTDRLKALSILLYVLGLSYRGVDDVLAALGFFLSYSSVYRNVQTAGEQVRKLKKGWLQQSENRVKVVGGDLTFVQCKGERVVLGIAVNAKEGIALDIEVLENEETETLAVWLEPLLRLVGAEVLETDDQDGFKMVADKAGVEHQICRRHVTLNVLDFVSKTVERVLRKPPPVPNGLDVTAEHLLADLETLEWILLGHPGNSAQLLEAMYDRYAHAPAPRKGRRASIWYRMRNHILRLWNNWRRHTCYRSFLHHPEFTVDETNNCTERVIGWNIKERYRTMRGYKRTASILNVSSLTAWLRELPASGDMSPLFAS